MAVFPATSGNVRGLLKKRFCAPEWALFFEVGDATGGRARRWADAVAMNLWPSRGLAIHGFEIKVSRSDWLGELRNPAKAEAIASKCDFWWLVAAEGIVQDGELPETWGLFEVNARGLIQRKAAPKLPTPELSREFMAALVRRAGEFDAIERDRALSDEREKMRKAQREIVDREVKERTRRHADLERAVKDFEEASGLSISGWEGGKAIGAAVGVVKAVGVGNAYRSAQSIAAQARRYADAIDKALAGMNAPVEDEGDL